MSELDPYASPKKHCGHYPITSSCGACQFASLSKQKTGILIANLGSPDAPTPPALRKYLAEFLVDRRVIETNPLLWWFILHGIVLRTRPRRSARLYSRIWTPEGSPLVNITRSFTEKLAAQLPSEKYAVRFGMRYGSKSIGQGIDELVALGCKELVVAPMYPQYSATTTASTYDAVFTHLSKMRSVPTLRFVPPYYSQEFYLQSIADSINSFVATQGMPDYLVFSYHGIPLDYVKRGDPYCCSCVKTTDLLLPRLKLPLERMIHTFQSRFGRQVWLEPYTDITIDELAKKGAKRIFVACPGFSADCLETLDEIGNEASMAFKEHGGEELRLIPCLNDQEFWVSRMAQWLRGFCGEEKECAHNAQRCTA